MNYVSATAKFFIILHSCVQDCNKEREKMTYATGQGIEIHKRLSISSDNEEQKNKVKIFRNGKCSS